MITLRHKDDIPLTEATLNEFWRMGNVGGITPDEKDPEVFRPRRFVSDGKYALDERLITKAWN